MTIAPKAPPTAVRIGDERLAHLEGWAEKQGIKSRHAAILAAIDKGCGFKPRKKAKAPRKAGPAKVEAAKAALAQAETTAAHLAQPPAPKPRSRWDLSDVQTGPSRPAPGSMLKSAKRR